MGPTGKEYLIICSPEAAKQLRAAGYQIEVVETVACPTYTMAMPTLSDLVEDHQELISQVLSEEVTKELERWIKPKPPPSAMSRRPQRPLGRVRASKLTRWMQNSQQRAR